MESTPKEDNTLRKDYVLNIYYDSNKFSLADSNNYGNDCLINSIPKWKYAGKDKIYFLLNIQYDKKIEEKAISNEENMRAVQVVVGIVGIVIGLVGLMKLGS